MDDAVGRPDVRRDDGRVDAAALDRHRVVARRALDHVEVEARPGRRRLHLHAIRVVRALGELGFFFVPRRGLRVLNFAEAPSILGGTGALGPCQPRLALDRAAARKVPVYRWEV